MDLPTTPEGDVLALPIRAQLFQALAGLHRPATTVELAALVSRHANGVRVHLGRLHAAGLVIRRRAPRGRGRPVDMWAVAEHALPAGRPPQAYRQLGRWLARAVGAGGDLEAVERTGREIGGELVDGRHVGGPVQAVHDALAALGFAPAREQTAGEVRFVLGNCPYREAVRESRAAVCTLHRGITQGLLDRVAPEARLADFVARDPYEAGCRIEVAGMP